MVANEQIVSMPIINPCSGGCSRTFRYMGKVDAVEDTCLVDWKGVASTERFICQLRIGLQAERYALALLHGGTAIQEIEYRLITRPSIRYCGKDADRDAYEERCLVWLDAPGKVMSHVYMITTSKLEQARWSLWDASKRLLENRRNDRWLTNDKACFAYERPCEYLELCDFAQNGADWEWFAEEFFAVLPSSHRELKGVDGNGDVLTHTSIGDLTLCEMLYFWRHERRLRKHKAEDSEALWVGSAIHAGLEEFAGGGQDAAFVAIDEWADANPILGEDMAHQQDQQVARARAMVRAAALKWDIAPQPSAAEKPCGNGA